MGKSDHYMVDHVRSAKMWLEKAERSFDSQSDIQGELNLMLAEAEMKNLRKKKKKTSGKRFFVAGLLFLCVAGGGAGVHVFLRPAMHSAIPEHMVQPVNDGKQSPTVEAVPDAVPESKSAPASVSDNTPVAPAVPADTEADEQEADTKAIVSEIHVPSDASAAEPVLTAGEVQAAVQDARHVLRSTAGEKK